MTGKEKSARTMVKVEPILRCPHCRQALEIIEFKLICKNHHTFDMAKQGYVNLVTHPVKTQYDRKLFMARRHIIMKSSLYIQLHQKIAGIIEERVDPADLVFVLDAGCGEGSHLQKILGACNNEALMGVGIDLSKEGVRMAASNFKQSSWFVGDLAATPFRGESFHVILNILSPANYKEFKRLSAPGSVVIKVVPRGNYLKELREAFYMDTAKEEYKNDHIISLFKKHFHLVDHIQMNYTKKLNSDELENLVSMTPLTWNLTEDATASFIEQGPRDITVELDILVGM